MKPVKPVLGIIFVFVLGVASGSFATFLLSQPRFESAVKGGPRAREEVLVKKLTKKLDLDERQHEQVETIIHETHEAIRQVRRLTRPQIETLLDASQVRISATLRPDQQAAFKKIITEHKARRPEDDR